MPIPVLPANEGFGTVLGQSISSAVTPMLQKQLSDYYAQKQNRNYALGLAQQLGVENPEKFAETYKYVSPNDLGTVLSKQLEAQALYQDLYGQQQEQGLSKLQNLFGQQEEQKSLTKPREDQTSMAVREPSQIQTIDQAQKPREIQTIDQAQQPEIKEGYGQIPGVEDLLLPKNTLERLITPKKFITPVGPVLKEKRKYQEERAKEDRAELAKYVDSFAPINELRDQAKNLSRLEQVLAKYDPNVIQKTLIASLDTGFTESLRKILTTEDQDIIESLIIPFVRTKDFGGSNPSTKEVLLKMKQYPSIYNSKSANKILLGAMKSYVMANLKKAEGAQAIRAINPDADPREVKRSLDNSIANYEKDFIDNDQTPFKIRQYDKKTKKYRQGSVKGFKGLESALADRNFETEVLD